jgi:hypothetical protein
MNFSFGKAHQLLVYADDGNVLGGKTDTIQKKHRSIN